MIIPVQIKKNNTTEAQKALVYIKTTTKKRNINPKSNNKNKNKQIIKIKIKNHTKTSNGSRTVKYFRQPKLSGDEDGEPKGQHSLSRGGSKDAGRDA